MNNLLSAICAAGFLAAGPASAATYLLDFTSTTEKINAISDNTFGDNAEADLSYRSIFGVGDVATFAGLGPWGSGYGDLDGALWSGWVGRHGEIRIEATNSSDTVTIDSFDMGGWASDRSASWYLFDLDWNVLAGGGTGTAPGPTGLGSGGALHVAPGTSATGGIIFQWGDDAYYVGVENFQYTVGSVAPIPIPASLYLLGAGVACLGLMRRRRRINV